MEEVFRPQGARLHKTVAMDEVFLKEHFAELLVFESSHSQSGEVFLAEHCGKLGFRAVGESRSIGTIR